MEMKEREIPPASDDGLRKVWMMFLAQFLLVFPCSSEMQLHSAFCGILFISAWQGIWAVLVIGYCLVRKDYRMPSCKERKDVMHASVGLKVRIFCCLFVWWWYRMYFIANCKIKVCFRVLTLHSCMLLVIGILTYNHTFV